MKKRLFILFFLFSYISLFAADIKIDGTTYKLDTISNFKVGPGTQYTAIRLQNSRRIDVFFLKVDLNNPYINYRVALGKDSIYGGERPTEVAARKSSAKADYFAGTNGDFYHTTGYVGMPIGCTVVENEMAIAPNGWKSVAFNEHNNPFIGVMTFSGNVRIGTDSFSIDHINHIRGANQLVLYNQHNGTMTRTNSYGTEVLIELVQGEKWQFNNAIKARIVKIEKGKGGMLIPKGSAVLSGHGEAQSFLDRMNIGDEIMISLNLLMDGKPDKWTNVVGGDRRNMMLKEGKVNTTDVWNERHPRTGFGYSMDKTTAIHCVVDGRGVSSGVTTRELAEIMKSAGAYDAFNLDGGGSSTLFVKDFGQMNTPSDNSGQRAVSNGIYVVSTAPKDDVVKSISAYQKTVKLPRFGVYKPKFLAYNQYGVLVNKHLNGVNLSCDESVGFINDKGELVASGLQGGELLATYQDITSKINIEIVEEAKINFRLDSVLIDGQFEYPIEVQSTIGLNTMNVYPESLNWEITNPVVCDVSNGVLRGKQNGYTYVIGNLGNFKDSLLVKVEIPVRSEILVDSFKQMDWKMKSSSVLKAKFSNTSLPNDWNHGATIAFTYKTTRSPYIKLEREFPLYSLPDTLKIKMDTGDVIFSKAFLSLRSNNNKTSTSIDINDFKLNSPTEVTIVLSDYFDTNDIATYPVWFEYINLYLDSKLKNNKPYTIALKEIELCYKNFGVTYFSPQQLDFLQIYPNPVASLDRINVSINQPLTQDLTVRIFNLNGEQVFSNKYNKDQKTFQIAYGNLVPGSYLIEFTSGALNQSTKFIVK